MNCLCYLGYMSMKPIEQLEHILDTVGKGGVEKVKTFRQAIQEELGRVGVQNNV